MTRTLAFAAILLLLGTGCGGDSNSAANTDPIELEIPLVELNGSAESGTALLTTAGDKTRVVIKLQSRSATPVAQPQPAHIHKGSCEKLDPTPTYALNDVKGGTSTSTVDVRLADLQQDAVVINVHESADNLDRYVTCGMVSGGSGEGYDPLGHDKESDY